jgi:hypothetical protein
VLFCRSIAMSVLQPVWKDFARLHFEHADLGDPRRVRRLVKVVSKLLVRPGGTVPQRFEDRADLVGFYRLMDRPEVTHASIFEPYSACVRQRMQTPDVVLLIHDQTELDFTSKTSIQGLGQIGNGPGKGYICHNTLAITPERTVLGLACQILHIRRQVPGGETPMAKRQAPDRESRLWVKASENTGFAPPGKLWIDIADRGADTFEFIAFEKAHGRSFVIRCARDRNLSGDDHVGSDRIYHKLFSLARDLPTLGTKTLELPAGKLPARTLQLDVKAGPVTIDRPHFMRGEAEQDSLDLWVICVREAQPKAGAGALEWLLLTDQPSGDFASACRHIGYYACRPIIEEYHKGQKTGMQIESLQFTDRSRLEPAIALLSVVTATLLDLRSMARDPQAQQIPAQQVVPQAYVKVLSRWRYGQSQDLSVKEFAMAMARLGGHQGRKGDGPPGWLTLYKGWEKLSLMVMGAYPAGP